ncbi:hypothetical protein BD410DRAFT_902506 [Rickenella mellea]|uniref:DUF6535 domain-containing protein n=1 Tax=Rickenella mellea TaxID=50990 RepID=A0A4Y7PLB5_9AGAM|nr:hypothetical protein BD410DRAFT_902506 [Rickenella mellea]
MAKVFVVTQKVTEEKSGFTRDIMVPSYLLSSAISQCILSIQSASTLPTHHFPKKPLSQSFTDTTSILFTMLPRRGDEEKHFDDCLPVAKDVSSETGQRTTDNINVEEDHGSNLWQLYVERAEKYDKDLVETWRDDMDSLLIFAALFSSCISAFVIESYRSLQQDSGDVIVSILLQISQQLANGTGLRAAAVTPPFGPDSKNVTINVFWFLSLAFSLVCSLAAVMVRQWARKYLVVSKRDSNPSYRASRHQIAFHGMQSWKMDTIVEMIPVLLHISLALFCAGLVLFLRLVNAEVQWCLIYFVSTAGSIYILLTITPNIFPRCPFKTPFTRLAFPLLLLWKCAVLLLALTLKGIVLLIEHGSMITQKAVEATMSSPIKPTPVSWPGRVHEFVKAVVLMTVPYPLLPPVLRKQAQYPYLNHRYSLIWNIVHFRYGPYGLGSRYYAPLEAFRWISGIATTESENILVVKGIPHIVRERHLHSQFEEISDLDPHLYLVTAARSTKLGSLSHCPA